MRVFRDLSIRNKLKLLILVPSSVAMLSGSVAMMTYDYLSTRREMAGDLSTLAKIIGANSAASIAFDNRDSAKEVLDALSANRSIASGNLYSRAGELFASYARDAGAGVSPDKVRPVSGSLFFGGHLIACEPVMVDGETIGTICVVSDLNALRNRVKRYVGVVALVLVGSLLIAFFISSRLQRVIAAPISDLARTALVVSVEKDYAIRAVKHGNDEMGLLIDAFNEMLEQIQERDARLQTARGELEQRVEERTKELQDEIAERERIQQVLRRSEEHFRSLIENASDIITIIDIKGTILYESPSVERVLGMKPEALIGVNAIDLAHPDDRQTAIALLMTSIEEGGAAGPFELRFEHADGSWRTLEVTGQTVRGESGAMEAIVNSRDVTERNRSEAALRESENNYRTILQSIQEGYYEKNLRGALTFFNDSLCRIVGTPAEKMKGLTPRDYLEPETVGAVRRAYTRILHTGKPLQDLQFEIKTPESAKFLEASASLRRDTSGQIVGFRGTIRDFTERKRAEEALKDSEKRYRALFESNPQPMWVYGADTLSFLAVNDAAVNIYGYSREEFLAMSIKDIRPQEDIGSLLESLENSILGFENAGSWRHRKKDGSIIDVEVSSHGLVFGGNRARLVLATDVTERKRATKELKDSELKYRALFNHIADPVFIFDKTTKRFVDCNDAVLRNYGYSVQELRTMSVFDLHPVEDLPKVERYIEVRNSHDPNTYIHVTKDGRRIDVEILTDEIEYQSRPCWISIVRDITERRQMEKEVTMLAHAIRSIQECVSVTDNDEVVLFANDAFLETYGYARHEVIGKCIRDIVRPQIGETVGVELPPPHSSSRWDGELVNRRKNGTAFPIHLSASRLATKVARQSPWWVLPATSPSARRLRKR